MDDKTHLDDLQQWADMWDNATSSDSDFFPQEKELVVGEEEHDEDDPYWNNVAMIVEAKGKTPNPVYPDSLNKDSKRPKTKKSSDSFKEIEKLKRKIYELECDLLGKEAGGNKWTTEVKNKKDVDKTAVSNLEKVKKMSKDFDNLCDELGFNDETEQSVYGYDDKEITK